MLERLKLRANSATRGQKRLIKVFLSGTLSIFVRFISVALGLISIPLTANYLGAERFGLWLILNTFIGWINLADLGLTNSLRTSLANASGKEELEEAKRLVSSAFWSVLTISLLLSVLFSLSYSRISWEHLFNVKSPQAIADANSAVVALFIIFILRLVFSISSTIYAAYQEAYIFSVWDFISTVISVIALVSAIYCKASVPTLVFVYFGSSLLGLVFSTVHIFGFSRRWLMPSLSLFQKRAAVQLLKQGFQFWIAQISIIVLFQTDLIIVAQLFSAEDVARYGITLKLFTMIIVGQGMFFSALWSAYSEALARRDTVWIIKTFRNSLVLSLIWCSLWGGLLIFFGRHLIHSLMGADMLPQQSLIVTMALTTVLLGILGAVTTFLSGLGEVKIQAVLGLPSGIFNILSSIFLARWLGVAGIAVGTGLTVAVTLVIYAQSLSKLIQVKLLKS